jgi:hypothetical protein
MIRNEFQKNEKNLDICRNRIVWYMPFGQFFIKIGGLMDCGNSDCGCGGGKKK